MTGVVKDGSRSAIVSGRLPPTPPDTDDDSSTVSAPSQSPSLQFPQPPANPPTRILDIDKKTPDRHVPRDPRLIRLTGVHPFNVEAPLTDLFKEGFLTSPELFYVRNHGAVPLVEDNEIADWELSVEGLVQAPFKLSLRRLLAEFQSLTYPITLVCAGNRRKEQNVVRKTKGFSWGAAGVSTALFTGFAMAELIKRAKPSRRAKYVCMEGADNLPNGHYATSLKMNWVMDPNRGIMVAYKMNGQMLKPDHGKPLRAIVPGQIGGRSVKWLTKLIITEGPSDNWYHIWDNRVLPTMVSPEESANNTDWWMDERYAIYDLNCNSAIALPAHDERLQLSQRSKNYSARGYAYSGGGRRITRVEISIDQAKSWRLASIDYPEDIYRDSLEDFNLYGGKLDMSWRESCFCWCFWKIDLALEELQCSTDILVRCMDESMQVQPRDMYWSVLGMMNNPWYRVAIHKELDYLRFEHPTQPALVPGGWMERIKKSGGDLTNGYWGEKILEVGDTEPDQDAHQPEIVKMTKDGLDKKITIEELRAHESESDPWFVVHGEVYDGTTFLNEHPGGPQSIISAAALDSTDEFMAIHSDTAKAMMPGYHIGSLDNRAKEMLDEGEAQDSESAEPRARFLDPRVWNKANLLSKTSVSWDTRIFEFKLNHEDQVLGLPTGQHLMMRLRDPATREVIIRPYTPISQETRKGYLDILVKVYFDTKDRKGGRMTQAMDSLPIGHFIEFKGPIGKFIYIGNGKCAINGAERRVKKFVMVCGGSGITPIFQVLRAIMQDRDDPTQCVVLNGNRLVEDILCKEQLDEFAKENEERCRLVHTLTNPSADWKGLRGRIGGELLAEHAPLAHDTMALICGPEPLEKSVHKALKAQEWSDDDLLFF